MAEYIQYFTKPFLDDLISGRCVPFVGAGFSLNASLPPDKKMPLWDELGKKLADEIQDYEYTGTIDALSAYEHEYSRPKLIEKLHQCLLVDCSKPGPTHRAFCELPFDLCVTTNFEFLLEKGYESVNKYCRPIIDEDQLSVESSGTEMKLLKLHGDLHHPNQLVATEDDYDSFIEKHPLLSTFLANLLIVRTAFFIGYSLDDPDFRQLWQIIGNRLGKLRRLAYTIAVSAPAPTVARFERRGVKVINIPGRTSEYPWILEQILKELRAYWSDTLIETSTSTEDESLAELSLPKDSISRLCFFSVPSRLSAYYKSVVFPLAERHGFAPVLAIDVISPGENISAKISALIDRAEVIVVDASTPNTIFELQMALAKRHERVFVILEEGAKMPLDFAGHIHLRRPKGSESESEQFRQDLDSWFERIAEELRPALTQEPERLLKKKEYRAAIISAMSLLESELRKRIREDRIFKVRPYISIQRAVEAAFEDQILTQEEAHDIKEWMSIRNKVVHLGESVSAKIAKAVVKGVLDIVRKLTRTDC